MLSFLIGSMGLYLSSGLLAEFLALSVVVCSLRLAFGFVRGCLDA